jgi:hypothetical protein
MIAMALRRGAKSKIGKARFGKCRLTITPPEFIKGVCERRIFRKKKLVGEDPPDPLIVYNTGLYQSIRSLVGSHRERVGFRHVRTPLCVVSMTVRFAHSGEIIQRMAKVWGSMGAVLRKRMCLLRLVSMLDI